ncbi:MAG: hypothetical protein K2X39_01300, partial [Silvanigrellaceae bacterium]|nr:hypothetical protein [Silvanigrellaceae bacterium]
MKKRLKENRKILEIHTSIRGIRRAHSTKIFSLSHFRSNHIITLNSLREANKYIFVQNFKEAEKILSTLSARFKSNYEIQFRRVEVACKTNSLDDLTLEFKKRFEENSQCLALHLSYLFSSIRSIGAQEEKQ